MNIKRFSVVILFLLFSLGFSGKLLMAKKVATLDGILAPYDIKIDEERIYITQQEEIYIYSLKDYRLIKKFGKKGEGPGEFKLSDDNTVFLLLEPKRLLINSVGRISYFSKSGEYLNERINNAGLWLQPLGKNFVGIQRQYDSEGQRYRVVCVFNEKLEKIKEAYKEVDGIQPRIKRIEAVTWPSGIFNAYDNKIFVADKYKTMHVYDQKGQPLYKIKFDFYEQIKVTSGIKQKYIRYFKEDDPYWRLRWERLKDWFVYPEYMPVVNGFLVSDQKIYVITHKTRGDKYEFLILDIKGKLLDTVFLPLNSDVNGVYNISPVFIKNSKLFQLVENEDEEEWELHATPIR